MVYFWQGQVVYHISNDFRKLEVIREEGCKVICKGERYVRGKFGSYWENGIYHIWKYELSNIPFDENALQYHKPKKWDGIINITPNMGTNILYLYDQYIQGELNMAPFYQRNLVWSLEQKRKFIENLFLEKAVITPTIILNWENLDDNVYEILDGKQRLITCFSFINDRFSIFDNVFFSDLSAEDKRFILRHDIRYTRIEKLNNKNLTDNEKIELFLEINELGTKVSQEHLDKVKEMIK